MALSMLDNKVAHSERSEWPAAIKAEFERESRNLNGCVGSELLSETDKVRVWIIRLKPGERIGFHRHVLDYFWTSVTGGRAPPAPDGRQHGRSTPMRQARRGTKPMAPANTRSTISRTSAART